MCCLLMYAFFKSCKIKLFLTFKKVFKYILPHIVTPSVLSMHGVAWMQDTGLVPYLLAKGTISSIVLHNLQTLMNSLLDDSMSLCKAYYWPFIAWTRLNSPLSNQTPVLWFKPLFLRYPVLPDHTVFSWSLHQWSQSHQTGLVLPGELLEGLNL